MRNSEKSATTINQCQWRSYRFEPRGELSWRGPLANTQKTLRNDSESGCGCLHQN